MSHMPRDPERVQFWESSSHDIVVDGWCVPLITAHMHGDDVMLVVDRRLAATFTREETMRIVPFLADAVAVSLGYGAHPNETDELPLVRAPHIKPYRVHIIEDVCHEGVDMDGPA